MWIEKISTQEFVLQKKNTGSVDMSMIASSSSSSTGGTTSTTTTTTTLSKKVPETSDNGRETKKILETSAKQNFATTNKTMVLRMQRELKMLTLEPPHGICAWPKGDKTNVIVAQIRGPEGTPFEGGTWNLTVVVPDRYPFEPPKVQFETPIYHPNIDSGGRICLDTLKMPPKGSWRPSVNLSTLLTTIRLLMATPNADDGLMPDITNLYKTNPKKFAERARQLTLLHATKKISTCDGSTSGSSSSNDIQPRNTVQLKNNENVDWKNNNTTIACESIINKQQKDNDNNAEDGESEESEEEESEESEEESEESEEEEEPHEKEPVLKKLKTV
jgi:ubiquitin-conjugating enzyme E2 T